MRNLRSRSESFIHICIHSIREYAYICLCLYGRNTDFSNVEWYGQGKTGVRGEKFVRVILCPPKIPQKLAWEKTRTSEVKRRRKRWYWLDMSYRTGIQKLWTEICHSAVKNSFLKFSDSRRTKCRMLGKFTVHEILYHDTWYSTWKGSFAHRTT